MTARRLPNDPKAFVRPTGMPLLALADVVPILPRLRCGECGGRLALEPPALRHGWLYCRNCARQYNEVAERLIERVSFEDMGPVRRGRPPKVPVASPNVLRQKVYRQRLRTGEAVKSRWSREYDHCVRCGTTESGHNGRGFCNRCKDAEARRQKKAESA